MCFLLSRRRNSICSWLLLLFRSIYTFRCISQHSSSMHDDNAFRLRRNRTRPYEQALLIGEHAHIQRTKSSKNFHSAWLATFYRKPTCTLNCTLSGKHVEFRGRIDGSLHSSIQTRFETCKCDHHFVISLRMLTCSRHLKWYFSSIATLRSPVPIHQRKLQEITICRK